jgi:hypothetical protein
MKIIKVCIIVLLYLVSPVCSATGPQQSFDKKSDMYKTKSFRGFDEIVAHLYTHNQPEEPHPPFLHHALEELYAQNPHLLHEQTLHNEEVEQETYLQSIIKNKKTIMQKTAHWGPFIFFLFQLYKKYNDLYVQGAHNQSLVQKLISYTFPSIMIGVPNHISFFLGGTELLLQAYLMKILLKMMIFLFF